MTIFIFLVGGIMFAHLFGLRMFQITTTKLNATADARKTFAKISDEIRTCHSASVGNIDNNNFVGLLNGEKQEGAALMIYPTTNSSYVMYFVNPADQTFRRTVNGTNTSILAESVTNNAVFIAQSYDGSPLTNSQNNRVIHVTLEFYQAQHFLRAADYYKLETSVTRRSLD
ncbi:MAG TPA: hypothetical protein VH255_07685 [Verrucomicrobiae bacterium]|nr:hypothetical protein [Verrucomicrobiae bacterium]